MKLNSIQVMRGVAALLVVFYHACQIVSKEKYFNQTSFEQIFQFGHAGVDFFFVLSGFIIYYVHKDWIGKPHKVKEYLLKRFIRIYPLYWCIFILLIPMVYLVRGLPDFFSMVKAFFLLEHQMIVYVAWTLVHEVLFYLIFVVLLINKRIGTLVMTAWLAAILISNFDKLMFHDWFEPMGNYLLSPYNLHFFFGLFTAILVHKYNKVFINNGLQFGFIGMALFLTAGFIELKYEDVYPYLIFGLSSSVLILGVTSYELNNKLAINRFLILIGSASYSIYLVHSPVQSAFAKLSVSLGLTNVLNVFPAFILASFISILTGLVVYKYMELPLLKLRRFIN